MFNFFILTAFLFSHLASANEKTDTYQLEAGFIQTFLYSQEYMKYFFADNSSDTKPLPAEALVLHLEINLFEGTHLVTSLSVPTNQEVVLKKDGKNFEYYYPKTVFLGLDTPLYITKLSDNLPLELRASGGLNTPLGTRMGEIFPGLYSHLRVAISGNAGLQVGLGYIGNIGRGVWLIPFGFSYRI